MFGTSPNIFDYNWPHGDALRERGLAAAFVLAV
jgi:hypothetical protein